jgi:8-oxo-dGTP diphosphatase
MDCARREVHEETGWEVGELTLLRINDNPDRPHEDRENVDFIYFGEAVRQTGEPDDETADMGWYDLDALPDREMIAFDHADDIDAYKEYLHKRFELPVLYNRS